MNNTAKNTSGSSKLRDAGSAVSNMKKSDGKPGDRQLTLRSLLDQLHTDGLISANDVQRLTSQSRSKQEAEQHPVNYIAEQQLEN